MRTRLAHREASPVEAALAVADQVPAAAPLVPRELLSDREGEIARLAVRGLSNKEIGQHLGISPWTVATHLRRMFLKLEITRRIELCAILSVSGTQR